MTLPVDTQTVRVFGTFLKPDGTAHKGEIEFRPAVPTYGGGVVVVGPVKAKLDVSGYFEVELVTSDNDVLNPDGWTYKVTEAFSGGAYRSYSIIAPNDVAEVNLDDLTSTAPTAPVQKYATVTQLEDVAERLFHHHVEASASTLWTIAHSLGYYPNVTIIDSTDEVVLADIAYPSASEVQITFATATSGRALLS